MSDSPDGSEVEIVAIAKHTEKTYILALRGCEPRLVPYQATGSRTPRFYMPARLVVVRRDGNVVSIKLSGPKIKKDGTPGSQWCDEGFLKRDRLPKWLDSIVRGLA